MKSVETHFMFESRLHSAIYLVYDPVMSASSGTLALKVRASGLWLRDRIFLACRALLLRWLRFVCAPSSGDGSERILLL